MWQACALIVVEEYCTESLDLTLVVEKFQETWAARLKNSLVEIRGAFPPLNGAMVMMTVVMRAMKEIVVSKVC